MKGIEQFLRNVFYFNVQERKGIRGLLCLLFIAIGLRSLLAWFEPTPILEFQLNEVAIAMDTFEKYEHAKAALKHKSYVRFTHKENQKKTFSNNRFEPKKNIITQVKLNVNLADSALWVGLPGIGPILASRIIVFRKSLGGFTNLNQLTQVYGFKEDLLFDLKEKLELTESSFTQFNINEVKFEELSRHPYFKYKLSRAIVSYRLQHGKFIKLADLRNIKWVNDSIFNLVVPYLKLE